MAAQPKRVKERWNNIPKTGNDERLYRGLTLNNNLKVLLISDSKTDKSAVALDVNIDYAGRIQWLELPICPSVICSGLTVVPSYNCDPPELAGLAHFFEHMLLTGSRRYEEKDFHQFCAKNGGKCNASTYLDHTIYHFEINPNELRMALNRFSASFRSPSFKKENIRRQISIMDYEHSVNMNDDTWRFAEIEKRLMKEGHPLGRSSLGPKTLLKVARENRDVAKEFFTERNILSDFFQNYYSSGLMSLCVLGQEELDYLEDMVVHSFHEMPNYTVDIPTYDENPYDHNQYGIKIFIKPLADTFAMMLRFPLFLQQPTHYYPELAHYFSYLLESQEEGTLLSTLKSEAWCNSLVSGKLTIAKNIISYFNIAIDLTKDGLSHIDEIITLVFQYIAKLREEGPLETVFDECQKIVDMNSRYGERSSPLSYVISKAQEMQIHPLDQIVYINRTKLTFEDWGKDMITEIMNCLLPQNVRIYIMTNLHESMFQDKVSDIGYGIEKIPEEIIDSWKKGYNKNLRLPTSMSPFMPTRFDIKGGLSKDSKDTKGPVIIKQEPLMRVWHKQDDEFLVPKTYTIIDLTCPYMDNAHLTMMFVELFCDSFKSYPYATEMAGIKWELFMSNVGLTFSISGYDDKQALLIEHLMDHLVKFKIDPDRFDIIREKHKQVLDKINTSHPYQYAMFVLSALLMEESQLPTSYSDYDVNIYVSLTRMRDYMQTTIFHKMYLECFIYGNTTKEEALKIADILHKKITEMKPPVSPSLSRDLDFCRELKLHDRDRVVYYEVADQHDTSCVLVFYQNGMRNPKSNVTLELIAQIISQPCQYILKTKKGLGHDISCGAFKMNATQGLRFVVQTDKDTTQNIEKEIDTFVDSICTRISRMTPTELNEHKRILTASRRQKTRMLSTVATMMWDEILMQHYKFDRITEEAEILESLTKRDIQCYCKKFLHSNIRRKLVIYIIQQKERDRLSKVGSDLSNYFNFRREHHTFPLLISDKYPGKGELEHEYSDEYSGESSDEF